MSEIKIGGLDQYGAGSFELQQFGTAGVEGVKSNLMTPLKNWTISSRRAVSLTSMPALESPQYVTLKPQKTH